MFRFLIFAILINLLISSCGPAQRDPNEAEKVKEEMSQREIKRVLPSEIIDKTREKGTIVADQAQKVLMQTLAAKIQSEGIVGAVEYCNLKALPIMDSLSAVHKATVRRISNRWRNPADAPTESEQLILEAYEYAAEQNQELREEVLTDDESGELIFIRPIMIGSTLCLQCHGTDIAPEVAEKLRELYPEDKATGYEAGEWRGLWKITFEKKDIVLEL